MPQNVEMTWIVEELRLAGQFPDFVLQIGLDRSVNVNSFVQAFPCYSELLSPRLVGDAA